MPEQVGIFLQARGTRAAWPAAAPQRDGLARAGGGICRAGGEASAQGGLADLETGATKQHKVQNAEHKDYARMSALTWKNTQRNI